MLLSFGLHLFAYLSQVVEMSTITVQIASLLQMAEKER